MSALLQSTEPPNPFQQPCVWFVTPAMVSVADQKTSPGWLSAAALLAGLPPRMTARFSRKTHVPSGPICSRTPSSSTSPVCTVYSKTRVSVPEPDA